MSPKVSEKRVREAAEELVDWRYGSGSWNQASAAGGDMRDWQVSGSRVTRGIKAAQKAIEATKQQTPLPKPKQPSAKDVRGVQAQIRQALGKR